MDNSATRAYTTTILLTSTKWSFVGYETQRENDNHFADVGKMVSLRDW
jgi:hypothetical protein